MYMNLLDLPLFNFVYLFLILFFLSFPLNIFVSFVFIALFPTWHLALVLFSSLCGPTWGPWGSGRPPHTTAPEGQGWGAEVTLRLKGLVKSSVAASFLMANAQS